MLPNENNIHDRFFKDTFSSVVEARAFLTHFVNPELWEGLDLDSLELDNISYLDENLKEYFADIVYNCQRKDKKEVKISFLFEHKSYYDKGLPVQLLRYLTEGYRRQYSEKPKRELSYIFPILLYHGKQRWKKHELKDMMNVSEIELNPYLPTFKYQVVDLGGVADKMIMSIKEGVYLSKTLILFKYKDDKAFVLKNSAKLLTFVERKLSREEKKERILKVLRYIFAVHKLSQKEIRDFSQKLKPMIQAVVGSYADVLFKKGVKVESLLSSTSFLFFLFKNSPKYTDKELAEIARCSTKMVKELRLILKNTKKEEVYKTVYQKYFKELGLSEKQEKELFEIIERYYKEDKKN